MIEILRAPPFATIQDLGFPRGRAWGLPRSGAMDPARLRRANELLGNPPGAAAIEWALGPGTIRLEEATRVAVTDGAALTLEGAPLDPATRVIETPAGASLAIAPGPVLRFLYVAVTGGIAVPEVFGSRSTYLPGAIGGLEGRRLKSGDRLPTGAGGTGFSGAGSMSPAAPEQAADVTIRVTRGPQWDRFDEDARATFFGGRYTVSASSDRMGYRLSGPQVRPRDAATLPSEAACPGAVQIPDGGQPIVLMPDGPTVGGYPKLAVVVRADLGTLAQCTSQRGIHFTEISLAAARACYSEGQ